MPSSSQTDTESVSSSSLSAHAVMEHDGTTATKSPTRERTTSFSDMVVDTLTSSFKSLTKNFSSPTLNTEQAEATPYPTPLGKHSRWTLLDTLYFSAAPKAAEKVKLPLHSFNHVAREVLSLEKSKKFYHEILGFDVCPRPPFDCNGYWLYGYGLSLHLVETTVPLERRQVKINRIKHFSSALPRVDHIAFVTEDIVYVKGILDDAKVYYKYVLGPVGIQQIFLFDPDGNVIEISNCAAEVGDDGEVRCPQLLESNKTWMSAPSLDEQEGGNFGSSERSPNGVADVNSSSSSSSSSPGDGELKEETAEEGLGSAVHDDKNDEGRAPDMVFTVGALKDA